MKNVLMIFLGVWGGIGICGGTGFGLMFWAAQFGNTPLVDKLIYSYSFCGGAGLVIATAVSALRAMES